MVTVTRISVVLAGIALMLVTECVFGQARDTASVYGTITDAQAAVIPDATVTLTITTSQRMTRCTF